MNIHLLRYTAIHFLFHPRPQVELPIKERLLNLLHNHLRESGKSGTEIETVFNENPVFLTSHKGVDV